uniref:DUF4996 domain-containing protein n=1 Tax=Heterorhabditis bacteriophora TaxID=37862 RepID=A0A1I7WX24_HETBA
MATWLPNQEELGQVCGFIVKHGFTTVVVEEGVEGWPQLLPTLSQLLDQTDSNMQEVSLE